MPGRLILTKDGSHTIEAEAGLTYHSTFGAIQESRHIFIGEGLKVMVRRPVRIFEMGFGTGLNALLSLMEGVPIEYEAVETEPLPLSMVRELNYCRQLGRPDCQAEFEALHEAAWGEPLEIKPGFLLHKSVSDIRGYRLRGAADVVYYDAFDPGVQPELWTAEVFGGLYEQLAPGAVLVTYCCKGVVRRALQSVGFSVEKLPGPPGKREMVRARKG